MSHYIMDTCIICGTCWEICPIDAIVEYKDYYRVTGDCDDCGLCLKPCPNISITKTGERGAKLEAKFTAEEEVEAAAAAELGI